MNYQSAGYREFINSMLEKRRQDFEAAKYREENKREDMQQMMKIGQQIGGSLISAQKQGQENATYNRMLNTMEPPRAEAVDPAMNARMAEMGVGPTAPHIGGKTEFDALMKMREADSKSFRDQVYAANSVTGADRAAETARRNKVLESQKQVAEARQARANASTKYNNLSNDFTAYQKEWTVASNAARNATDPNDYMSAQSAADGIRQAAIGSGIDPQYVNSKPFPTYQGEEGMFAFPGTEAPPSEMSFAERAKGAYAGVTQSQLDERPLGTPPSAAAPSTPSTGAPQDDGKPVGATGRDPKTGLTWKKFGPGDWRVVK